jgi:hypothetical protein
MKKLQLLKVLSVSLALGFAISCSKDDVLTESLSPSKVPNAAKSTKIALSTLPTNFALHYLADSYVAFSDKSICSNWYYEKENRTLGVFRLFNGDVNTYDDNGVRIEAFTPNVWKASSASDWHEFQCTYSVDALNSGGTSAIMQQKSLDTDVQWEVQINSDPNGDIRLNHRRLPDVVLATNMKGKPFTIKVRSNGRKYQVYFNGVKKADVDHQMDPSGASSYAWRWGIYTRDLGSDTRLVISNLSYN